MNKTIINYIAIAIIAFTPIVTFASPEPIAKAVEIPATGNSNSSATPSTGESTSTAQPSEWSPVIIIETPITGESTSSATPTTGESTSTAVPPTPTPNPTSSGSSGSSSSSGGSRSGFGNVYGCPMITSFLKYGANNDTIQVTKLQNFLKNVEKINVDINGIFDKKTEDAVKVFQNKYSETTMGPWGETQGTGFVYITTLKQINKIACNQPLTLSASELAIINANKNSKVAQSVIVTPNESPAIIEIDVDSTNSDIGTESNEENTATVGKASIMSRFWNFIVYLFK